jgi:hypothetical protein
MNQENLHALITIGPQNYAKNIQVKLLRQSDQPGFFLVEDENGKHLQIESTKIRLFWVAPGSEFNPS